PHLTHHHLARYGPLIGRPYLLTVHDLIRYFDLRGFGVFINPPNLRDRICLRLDYRGFVTATAIISVSRTTKWDLTRHLGIPPDRIFVVHEGLDHDLFRPVERRLVDSPYVLFVGSEHPRKNLATLLRAFAALKRERRFRSLRLVKVGAAGSSEAPFRAPTRELVHELGLERDVVFTEEVPDEDLPAYYSGAACLVLPSRYEGFGFPPLEAMACGCPVVISSAGALAEVAGEAALRVAADDVDGFRAAMRAVVTEPSLSSGLRERGFNRAREFSWERAARDTALVYEIVSARCVSERGVGP
ncbi:MAG: glycosyltransferase family 4 protein, partial [Actinomycetota bacterium]|nr:glycosyltransferase family 4 protein [Actinomycetota bacterium]